ncbi:MAG: hypothetical protein MJ252_08295 [archaeon]|nr:hypothetical protein [archaeon]
MDTYFKRTYKGNNPLPSKKYAQSSRYGTSSNPSDKNKIKDSITEKIESLKMAIKGKEDDLNPIEDSDYNEFQYKPYLTENYLPFKKEDDNISYTSNPSKNTSYIRTLRNQNTKLADQNLNLSKHLRTKPRERFQTEASEPIMSGYSEYEGYSKPLPQSNRMINDEDLLNASNLSIPLENKELYKNLYSVSNENQRLKNFVDGINSKKEKLNEINKALKENLPEMENKFQAEIQELNNKIKTQEKEETTNALDINHLSEIYEGLLSEKKQLEDFVNQLKTSVKILFNKKVDALDVVGLQRRYINKNKLLEEKENKIKALIQINHQLKGEEEQKNDSLLQVLEGKKKDEDELSVMEQWMNDLTKLKQREAELTEEINQKTKEISKTKNDFEVLNQNLKLGPPLNQRKKIYKKPKIKNEEEEYKRKIENLQKAGEQMELQLVELNDNAQTLLKERDDLKDFYEGEIEKLKEEAATLKEGALSQSKGQEDNEQLNELLAENADLKEKNAKLVGTVKDIPQIQESFKNVLEVNALLKKQNLVLLEQLNEIKKHQSSGMQTQTEPIEEEKKE